MELGKRYQEEYIRSLGQIQDDDFNGRALISHSEVLKAHFAIAEYFHEEGENLLCGVKSFDLLSSAVGRQMTGFGGVKKWNTSEEHAATLFYGLIKNHAFHDANKRTALLVLIFHLLKQGKMFKCTQKELDKLAISVAEDSLNIKYRTLFDKFKHTDDPEIYFLSYFIRRNSRLLDSKFYPVTYHEFNRLLNRHNVFLENPHGNFIDVVKIETVIKKSFFSTKKETIRRRVCQIGFPTWKAQVGKAAIKEVLKSSGLTIENGIDTQVFFHEAQPLDALIQLYSEPLKRLKNK